MIHINYIKTDGKLIFRKECPDCKRNSYFAGFYQAYYGTDSTCMNCGRHWQDGEWVALPFMRGAREKSKEAARRRWRCGFSS